MDKTNLYYAVAGDIIIDTKTGLEWTFKKYYRVGNYDFYQIERCGKVRKLSLFKEAGSIADVDRYKRKLGGK